MNEKKRVQQVFIVLAGLGLMVMSSCSTYATLSREKISEGNKAIREARESNANLNAPVELKAAEDKLAEARVAFNNKDYGKASQLAEQALVDADFARAKGISEKTKKKVEEIQENINALRQEIELLSKEITLKGGK
jgi:hypothetical protein